VLWKGGLAPLEFEIRHFLNKFVAKKVVFLVSSKKIKFYNFCPTLENLFCYRWKIPLLAPPGKILPTPMGSMFATREPEPVRDAKTITFNVILTFVRKNFYRISGRTQRCVASPKSFWGALGEQQYFCLGRRFSKAQND